MKIGHALLIGVALAFSACVATAEWTPTHAAQPDAPKKPKTLKHKKPVSQNAAKPQGEVSRPEIQKGY